jgi:hypothetical protein
LAKSKLFKIIFNTRYDLFSNEKIFKNDKIFIHDYKHDYKFDKKTEFPIFEYKPEDIWNSYCICLNIEPINQIDFRKMSSKKGISSTEYTEEIDNNTVNNEEEDYEEEYYNFDRKNLSFNIKEYIESNLNKNCALCGKLSDKCCSDCNMRFYLHFFYLMD